MAEYPSNNDNFVNLLKKIVNNTATIADGGGGGSSAPVVVPVPTGTSITPNLDQGDIFVQVNTQGAGTLTVGVPTGTKVDGQKFTIRLKSTNVQTFSWNAAYRASNDLPLPTVSTGGSKTDYLVFSWNATDSKWDLLGKTFGF